MALRLRLYSTGKTWERIREALRRRLRVSEERSASRSGAIIDRQSVKTTEARVYSAIAGLMQRRLAYSDAF